MLWVLLTLAAAPLQVARNAAQRGLMGDAGPWGATLVRFLFGLPFSILIFSVVAMLTPEAAPRLSWRFGAALVIGAGTQVAATAALLMAMRRAGFAVGTVMQQVSLPLSAIAGWLILGDALAPHAWMGVALTTVGIVVLSAPARGTFRVAGPGIAYGLLAGALFAVNLNAYRQAGLALDPGNPIYSGVASVIMAQALQSACLSAGLAVWRPEALKAAVRSWRISLGAGVFGASASACWFAALAMAPAGLVRAIGVVEAPIAAAAGRKLFNERLTLRQMLGGATAAAGVVLAALG